MNILHLEEEESIGGSSYSDKMILGAPGTKIYVFKPMKEGNETMQLVYCRAWEVKRKGNGEIDWDKVK